jgi:hypothetical protein
MSANFRALTARTRRRARKKVKHVDSRLHRQWKLLQQVSLAPITLKALAKASGVSLRTIKRDFATFRRIDLPVVGLVGMGTRSEKRWYLQPPFERLKNKTQRYFAIRKSLTVLVEQARAVGDQRLIRDLETVQRRVEKKCQRRKAR